MNPDSFSIKENALTAEIYETLRDQAGFVRYSRADARAALEKTLHTAVAFDGKQPVGIARVVGDGRIVFFIKDVVVSPAYQGRQIGSRLMENLLNYIRAKACPHAYVGLMATPGSERFYERLGFQRRPTPLLGAGMVLFVNQNAAHDYVPKHEVWKGRKP